MVDILTLPSIDLLQAMKRATDPAEEAATLVQVNRYLTNGTLGGDWHSNDCYHLFRRLGVLPYPPEYDWLTHWRYREIFISTPEHLAEYGHSVALREGETSTTVRPGLRVEVNVAHELWSQQFLPEDSSIVSPSMRVRIARELSHVFDSPVVLGARDVVPLGLAGLSFGCAAYLNLPSIVRNTRMQVFQLERIAA